PIETATDPLAHCRALSGHLSVCRTEPDPTPFERIYAMRRQRKTAALAALASGCGMILLPTIAFAQPAPARPADAPPAAPAPVPAAKDYSNSPLVTRMMAFDKDHDGKLTRDEVTDERL